MSALVSAVLVAFLAGTVADAQVLYGSIVGNVTDSTGAAVPGATVTIEQAETKLTRELVADAAGAYHFTAVPSGTYSVTVTMNGFRSFSRKDVPVTLNSVARVDAKLDVGQLAETVQRVSRVADTADRPSGSPCRTEDARADGAAGSDRPQLPAAVQDAARVHAAGRRALDSVEPVPRPRLQRERLE